jgi:hypothetical protein
MAKLTIMESTLAERPNLRLCAWAGGEATPSPSLVVTSLVLGVEAIIVRAFLLDCARNPVALSPMGSAR